MLVLENAELAEQRGARVLGELIGYAATSDAHHLTAPHPEGEGAARAITLALRDAGLDAGGRRLRQRARDVDAAQRPARRRTRSSARSASAPTRSRCRRRSRRSGTCSAPPAPSRRSRRCWRCATASRRRRSTTSSPTRSCDLDYVPDGARPLAVNGAPPVAICELVRLRRPQRRARAAGGRDVSVTTTTPTAPAATVATARAPVARAAAGGALRPRLASPAAHRGALGPRSATGPRDGDGVVAASGLVGGRPILCYAEDQALRGRQPRRRPRRLDRRAAAAGRARSPARRRPRLVRGRAPAGRPRRASRLRRDLRRDDTTVGRRAADLDPVRRQRRRRRLRARARRRRDHDPRRQHVPDRSRRRPRGHGRGRRRDDARRHEGPVRQRRLPHGRRRRRRWRRGWRATCSACCRRPPAIRFRSRCRCRRSTAIRATSSPTTSARSTTSATCSSGSSTTAGCSSTASAGRATSCCAWARIEGRPVGIVANQPRYIGGVLDAEAAQKAARFVRTCHLFGMPLVAVVDTPGFMPGTEPGGGRRDPPRRQARACVRRGAGAEADGDAAQELRRRAHRDELQGARRRPRALPGRSATLGVMGAEQAVNIVHRRHLAAVENVPAERASLAAAYAESTSARRTRRGAGLRRRGRSSRPRRATGWPPRWRCSSGRRKAPRGPATCRCERSCDGWPPQLAGPPSSARIAAMSELFQRDFDELPVGDRSSRAAARSPRRTSTSSPALPATTTRLHTDAVCAARAPFGERVAHGLLVLSCAVGLVPFDPSAIVALRRHARHGLQAPGALRRHDPRRGRDLAASALDDDAGLVTANPRPQPGRRAACAAWPSRCCGARRGAVDDAGVRESTISWPDPA